LVGLTDGMVMRVSDEHYRSRSTPDPFIYTLLLYLVGTGAGGVRDVPSNKIPVYGLAFSIGAQRRGQVTGAGHRATHLGSRQGRGICAHSGTHHRMST